MSLKSKLKHSKLKIILWFLSTDKLVKTRLRLVFSNQLEHLLVFELLLQSLAQSRFERKLVKRVPVICTSHTLFNVKVILFTLDKPENIFFKGNPANSMITVCNSITITCKADASPSPNYTILHNDEILKDVFKGVKTFKSVKRSDEGSYNCTAKNFLGIASDDLKLNVNGKIWYSSLCFQL